MIEVGEVEDVGGAVRLGGKGKSGTIKKQGINMSEESSRRAGGRE